MEKTGKGRTTRFAAMLNRISHTGVWVEDQDQALTFYRDALGFEVRADVTVPEFGNMRWRGVGRPGAEVNLLLQSFDLAPMDDAARERIRQSLATGFNPPLIFQVEDCRATIEELRERGVDISQEPEEQFYGIDAGIRDPSGNSIRITQPAAVPAS